MKFKAGDKVLDKRRKKTGILMSNERCISSPRHLFCINYDDGDKDCIASINEIELISSFKFKIESIKYPTIMNKLTAKIKRIFKENQRLQYKARLIDDCGNLTMQGEDEQKELISADYDDKLTERAKEIIEEEKENKK